MTNETVNIAFIGLGAMGLGMAENLINAGHSLHIAAHQNRDPVDLLVSKGATEWSSPAEAATASSCIFLCLPNSMVVEELINDLLPVLRSDHVVVDTGTSLPSSTANVYARFSSINVAFAEAPVAGGMQQAKEGKLGALVGADEETFKQISPIMDAFCSTMQHFGPVGTGGHAKLLSNYMVLGFATSVIEAFYAAKASDVDWSKLYEVAVCGAANSGVLQRIAGSAVDGDFMGYAFTVRAALKDYRYINKMSEELGLGTLDNPRIMNLLETADKLGFGNLRISELLRDEVRAKLALALSNSASGKT